MLPCASTSAALASSRTRRGGRQSAAASRWSRTSSAAAVQRPSSTSCTAMASPTRYSFASRRCGENRAWFSYHSQRRGPRQVPRRFPRHPTSPETARRMRLIAAKCILTQQEAAGAERHRGGAFSSARLQSHTARVGQYEAATSLRDVSERYEPVTRSAGITRCISPLPIL